jgi:tetratricopeptide (TPR) repeat protein
MRCPHCEANTPDGAKFCIECGTPLKPRRPRCGAETLPRAKFCGECGTPLTAQSPAPPFAPPHIPLRYTPRYLAEKVLTSRAALEGERKQVTVLFADLKGSMELLAERDPEEACAILDPVLERMMDAVHRYEGTVNQVMGDGIMALFGAPLAHEDHAVRACYAALAMRASLRRYSNEVRRRHGLPPEYQHAWASKTYYTQLRLDPLPPASADELLQALLGDDPSLIPLTRLLVARTEGNPFFLEESVRTLVETGTLVGEPGAYRLTTPLDSLQIPVTVQTVLAARIDRLPLVEKHLLQTAAVIGTEVPLPQLEIIAELPEETLQRGLTYLQAAEFLYETSLFPERTYTFKHALAHEVAYESLLHEQRCVLHARIVEALEGLGGERLAGQVERLAHHAFRGEVWDKALAYGRLAGEKALARSAQREAGGYLEQALRALPHLPETREMRERAIDLRLARHSVRRPFGDSGRLLASLREAESLAAALNDPRRLGRVSILLSHHFDQRGAFDQVTASAQRALELAAAGGDVVLHALANQYLGFAYQAQGGYRRAIDCFRQTLASLDGARRRERFGRLILPAVESCAELALCHPELGTFAEGRTVGEEALRIAEAVAHPGSLICAACGNGLPALRQGDLPRALPLLERAVGLCQDVDLPVLFSKAAAALGAAYTRVGALPTPCRCSRKRWNRRPQRK